MSTTTTTTTIATATATRVVYVDMVGDLFHAGHVSFLSKVKSLYPDSKIYVGLMADDQAASYKRRPILTITERSIIVAACRFVDQVFLDAPMPITREFIERNNIDLVVHGDDISEQASQYWYRDPIEMGIYKEIPYTKGISTSEIISRLVGGAALRP